MTKIFKNLGWLVFPVCIIFLAGCHADTTPAAQGGVEMSISLTSTAFKEGEMIPRVYTCDDKNVSPPLAWTDVPTTTVSLALIMDDPDAPSGTWVHWVLLNLPAGATGLSQGDNGGGVEGVNDFKKLGYGGPCPPRGSTHRYYIKIYALDTSLGLKAGSTKSQVESAMRGHILSQGQLIGKYGR